MFNPKSIAFQQRYFSYTNTLQQIRNQGIIEPLPSKLKEVYTRYLSVFGNKFKKMNILNEVVKGASQQFGREFGRAGANAVLKGKNYYTVNHSIDYS